MGFYIDGKGQYYQGDKVFYADKEVLERPNASYKWDGTQWIQDPELLKIYTNKPIEQQLTESDASFIRVIDDLITVLLTTNKIKDTDLPTDAYNKYLERVKLRKKILK